MNEVSDDTNAPAIGIDLDGTIDESPEFFRLLSQLWPGRVVIITYRDDRQKAIDRLAEFDMPYDELILVDSFEAKAVVVQEQNISVYFDDQDEMLQGMPESVTILKIRNGGNFDFDTQQWLFSDRTGRRI